MAKNLLNKYVWLVDTIYRAGKITYEEISRRWLDKDLSEGNPLPLRTFHLVAGTDSGYTQAPVPVTIIRESIYKLSGTVELDEAFFPTRMEADEKAEPMKRGAGSQRQSKVLVIVESKAVDDILRHIWSQRTSQQLWIRLQSLPNGQRGSL